MTHKFQFDYEPEALSTKFINEYAEEERMTMMMTTTTMMIIMIKSLTSH